MTHTKTHAAPAKATRRWDGSYQEQGFWDHYQWKMFTYWLERKLSYLLYPALLGGSWRAAAAKYRGWCWRQTHGKHCATSVSYVQSENAYMHLKECTFARWQNHKLSTTPHSTTAWLSFVATKQQQRWYIPSSGSDEIWKGKVERSQGIQFLYFVDHIAINLKVSCDIAHEGLEE